MTETTNETAAQTRQAAQTTQAAQAAQTTQAAQPGQDAQTAQDGGQGRKTVGIVGLGLIGGSFAKAYHEAGWRVLAFDVDEDVMRLARIETIDGRLDRDTAASCDLVLLCVYPGIAIDWLKDNRDHLGAGSMVIDCCSVKRAVVEACMPLAEGRDFTYVGGHPMAGTQYSGFKYARANLFHGAPMVLVPPRTDDPCLLEQIELLLAPAGFGSFKVTDAEEHDRRIAYTSQLAHVVSSAYVKSPTAQGHKGFSAGSYKDLTRVAWLNETMWTELFLDDKDNLLFELNHIIEELSRYRDAIEAGDAGTLKRLLREGREAKERAEGRKG